MDKAICTRKGWKEMYFDSYAYTSAGGREENQDAVGKQEERNSAIYVVADGLGGHQLGNLASEIVVRTMEDTWKKNRIQDKNRLLEAVKKANRAVLQLQADKRCSSKSTIAVLVIDNNRAFWANTGDTRIYCISGGRFVAMTEDHSVAYKKYKAGEISKEQIAWDEDQSCLLRALGNETRWEPNISGTASLKTGSAFLLCSDGLWEYISEEEILKACVTTVSAAEWGEKMIQTVKARFKPGHDNYSLITVKLK